MARIAWRCVSVRMELIATSLMDSVTVPSASWERSVNKVRESCSYSNFLLFTSIFSIARVCL